ncbi:PHD finger domain protein, partial [Aspergillus sp. HF37]
MSAFSAVNPQGQSRRQTRTNPSRTSKSQGRSSFAYGHSSLGQAAHDPTIAHGLYPALSHFTDAVTALPREFRRHNSLLKEVDAKAWALEDNLLQLLKSSSETPAVACPPNPAPIINGAVREDVFPRVRISYFAVFEVRMLTSYLAIGSPATVRTSRKQKPPSSLRSRSLCPLRLMMTADEKNHVISNANDELDRQLNRLDTIFPYIGNEISDESRLGSLTHWAYTNRNTVKAAASERPRREAATHRHDLTHALHEAEAGSREAKREAAAARKHRRAHADSDFDDPRPHARKGHVKPRGTAAHDADHGTTAAKRRKVERIPPFDTGPAMERSASGTGNPTGRNTSKDAGPDAAKKRSRAPNTNAASRKRNTTAPSAAVSPILAPSPVVGTFNPPRSVASPGPNSMPRPQSSRTQNSNHAANGRQRPPSSTSNRMNNNNKSTESKAMPKDAPSKAELATSSADVQRSEAGDYSENPAKMLTPLDTKGEEMDGKPAESVEAGEPPASAHSNPAPKGRSSKTSTPVLSTFGEVAQRARPTRSTDPAPGKRSHKKRSSVSIPQPVLSEDESVHGGDDEDDETEPRYCYCNEVSFGEMVACDNDACPREWFHLSCVGMSKPPGKNVK